MTEPQPTWETDDAAHQAALARAFKLIWRAYQEAQACNLMDAGHFLQCTLSLFREQMDNPTRHGITLWERAQWRKRRGE